MRNFNPDKDIATVTEIPAVDCRDRIENKEEHFVEVEFVIELLGIVCSNNDRNNLVASDIFENNGHNSVNNRKKIQ